jgi:hypothetical protein
MVAITIAMGFLISIDAQPAFAGTTATGVLGQPNFASASANNVTAEGVSTSNYPYFSYEAIQDAAIDNSVSPNRLYVIDVGNNRVLGYSNVNSLSNGQTADVVIGPPTFYTASGSLFSDPRGIAADSSGNLYVADSGNNRVVIFSSPLAAKAQSNQSTGFQPFMVLGQGGSFGANRCNVGGSAPDAETLCDPTGLALDAANNLYVSDTGNNRVLEYSNPVGTGRLVANLVFGQGGSFTSNATAAASATTFDNPGALAVDGVGNLFVADTSNERVLEFNTPLSVTGVSGSGDTIADTVFGQGGSFTTSSCSEGAAVCAASEAWRLIRTAMFTSQTKTTVACSNTTLRSAPGPPRIWCSVKPTTSVRILAISGIPPPPPPRRYAILSESPWMPQAISSWGITITIDFWFIAPH